MYLSVNCGDAHAARICDKAADHSHGSRPVSQTGGGRNEPRRNLGSRAGKGQFYHYFGSKEGLVHEVLQSYIEGVETGTSPINYEVRSWEDLERWFAAHIELQKKFRMTRGCPFGTVGNGVTEKDELIRQDLSHLFEIVKDKLRAFFIREKAQGRLTAAADEDRLADFCIATIQGAMLMGKVKRSAQPVDAAVREALAHPRRYVVRT
jgi:TetR/AcrR family transcriptional regulator, transcriptional repressor for nem operon